MANLPLEKRNEFRADLLLIQKAVRGGVTRKRASAHDEHWGRWLDFCLEHQLDPYLAQEEDPVPILQIFLQRYRDGRIAPSGDTVRSRTAEDALRAVGQKFASVGSLDPRKDAHGKIDFRITRQLRYYTKNNAPPSHVKPVPITLVMHILRIAHNGTIYILQTQPKPLQI